MKHTDKGQKIVLKFGTEMKFFEPKVDAIGRGVPSYLEKKNKEQDSNIIQQSNYHSSTLLGSYKVRW